MELLKINDHFIVSDFVSNGSFASLRENVQYKSNEDYAILVRITDFVKKWNGDYVYINEKEYNFLNKSKVFPGDLIISNVGQPGLSFILPNLNKKTSLAPNSIFVRPKTEKIYNLYFYYFLKTPDAQKIIESICTKTTLKKFNKTSFKNLTLPFPFYQNQIRIANLLEKIETTIAERKNAIDLLDELVKATFYQMFGEPVKNEKGWNKDNLDSVGKIERGVSKHRPRNAPELLGGNYPLIQTGEVSNAGLWLEKYSKTYSELGLKQSKLWPKGTLLITIAANIAKTSILTFDACFPDSIVGFIANERKSNTIFIHYLLGLFQDTLEKNAPQSAQKNINLGILRELLLPLPPIALQNQFADIAKKIEHIKAEQEAQSRDLEELYASVSQKVFEGDIDLSKVPFDASLLPNPVEVTKEKPIEQPDVVVNQELPKEKKTITKGKLTWEIISFKEVADYIREEFDGHYFNAEMLLRFLREDIGMQVNYFSSAEQKKNPQYENADDFYRFIVTALSGENHFLQLEQVFYNAETENIPNISFTETDLENLSKRDKKERSGIYFHIKDETTTP
jgi:type I restriction enzyme S subunit